MPENYWSFHIKGGFIEAYPIDGGGGTKPIRWSADLPPGEYEFLFTSDGVTEEQLDVVFPQKVQGYGYRNFIHPDYNGGSSVFDVWIPYSCKTRIESLHSLLASKGIEGNCAILKVK